MYIQNTLCAVCMSTCIHVLYTSDVCLCAVCCIFVYNTCIHQTDIQYRVYFIYTVYFSSVLYRLHSIHIYTMICTLYFPVCVIQFTQYTYIQYIVYLIYTVYNFGVIQFTQYTYMQYSIYRILSHVCDTISQQTITPYITHSELVHGVFPVCECMRVSVFVRAYAYTCATRCTVCVSQHMCTVRVCLRVHVILSLSHTQQCRTRQDPKKSLGECSHKPARTQPQNPVEVRAHKHILVLFSDSFLGAAFHELDFDVANIQCIAKVHALVANAEKKLRRVLVV